LHEAHRRRRLSGFPDPRSGGASPPSSWPTCTLGKPVYTVELLSEEGGMVRSSSGVSVDTKRFGTARSSTRW
jgi:hypothetical protein